MINTKSKKSAPGDTKTELYPFTVPPCKERCKLPALTPEQAVDIFGRDILPIVTRNLSEQYFKLFRLSEQIAEIERIILKLPIITNQISLRALYEAMLPRIKRERTAHQKHINFLGRCIDIIRGTSIFTPKPTPAFSNVNEIKARLNICDVVARDVDLRQFGKTLKGRCPFHNDRTPSFVVYPDEGNWWCFSCNEGGDVITYIQKLRQCSFREALAELQNI